MNEPLSQKLTEAALKAVLSGCIVLGASLPTFSDNFGIGSQRPAGNSGNIQSAGVRIVDDGTLATVISGGGHTLAIKEDGSLWAWGRNHKSQLGGGTKTNRNAPVQLGEESWVTGAEGFNFSRAITRDGTLWDWGYNTAGHLGTGAHNDSLVPMQIGTAAHGHALTLPRLG